MVHLENHNLIFYHAAKNAGTSIEGWLSNIDGAEVYNNDLRHETPGKVDKMFDGGNWSFCVTRNPWDRFYSWYSYWKTGNRLIDNDDFNTYVEKCLCDPSEGGKVYIPNTAQHKYYRHVDYIIRYENINKDFELIQEKTNCYEPLFHRNKSERSSDYTSCYNDKSVDLIAQYYKIEVEELGYKFGG